MTVVLVEPHFQGLRVGEFDGEEAETNRMNPDGESGTEHL